MSGSIVGIVALPLTIALGIASGVSPEQGLYTAIIAGFLISFLGGSRVQIGGPAGAFVIVDYAIVQEHGYNGLAMATMIAGIFLMLMGIVRMGGVIKFNPYPMTAGFTSGIALIVGVSQFKDFLGLTVPSGSAGFLHQLIVHAAKLGTVTPWSVVVGLLSLGIMLLWPRLTRKVPSSLVAIITTSLLVKCFAMPVETIGTQFGEVTSMLLTPRLPAFEWQILPALVPHALIAILGGIESAAFRRGCKPHDRQETSFQHGTYCPGSGQFSYPFVRRHTSHRHNCPDSHKHQERCQDAGLRYCTCPGTSSHPGLLRKMGHPDPYGKPCCRTSRRGL